MFRLVLGGIVLASLVSASLASGPGWTRHIVVDERLSALRTRPALDAPLTQRLRVGRRIFEVGRGRDREGRIWLRVAVTRRTRGWLLSDATARHGDREGERRLGRLIESLDGIDRIAVARVALDLFPRLRGEASAAIEDESRDAAEMLTERATRRLGALPDASPYEVRALFLSDPGLDRYNRLGVLFDVDVETRRFVPRRPGRR